MDKKRGERQQMKVRIKYIFLMIIGLLIAGILISKINHEIKLQQEKKQLEAYGVGKTVEVDGKKLNVYLGGEAAAKGTLVYMHGLGMGDTTISARPMLEKVQQQVKERLGLEYQILIMDRYGNGMSEDTSEEQTVEKIVNTYRQALKSVNKEGPYLLVAHSISGMYATYWGQHYPEEIEEIVYLDADPVECYVEEGPMSTGMQLMCKAQNIFASTGLQRVLVSEEDLIGKDENHTFSEEENTFRKKLMYQHTYSKATYLETKHYYTNAQAVIEESLVLPMPQLYIQADRLSGKYYDLCYKQVLEERFEGNQDKIENYIKEQNKIMEKKREYMNTRGNIMMTTLSGPHCLYEYAPDEVAHTIVSFLEQNR